MKNLIKRLGSGRGRGYSISSSEDGSSDNKLKQPFQHQLSKINSRLQEQKHRNRRQQRQESRSDSKSLGHRTQHHYQQTPRESGVRDLFQFLSRGEQKPQKTRNSHQQRHQAVSRTTGASYNAQQQQQQQFIDDHVYYDENQHHFHSYNNHHHQYQHGHYQRDFEAVRVVPSTSPLSFYGPGASSDNDSIYRPQQRHHHHHQQQQQQQHRFEFDSDGVNFFTHDEDNGRVRFFSSSSSVSSSVSEEPSQVHMMAGCGQSVASSSCMSGSSSYYLNSKGDLVVLGKAMRGAKYEDEERLRAMGLISISQDDTPSGRSSPEQRRNDQLEAGFEMEYHDVRDEEIHHHHDSTSLVSAPRASVASSRSGPPSNDKTGDQEGNEKKDEFSLTSISKWSSSYFR